MHTQICMVESRIYKGYWWLPTAPDERIAGTLSIEPNGTVKLDLFGCFGQVDFPAIIDRKDDSAIFGRCYTPDSKMTDISLMNCHSGITLNFSDDTFPITKYTCQYALIGIHVDSMENASFFKAHVNFKELAYWCPPNNITTTLNNSAISINIKTAYENASPLATMDLEDGYRLNLNEGATYKEDYPKVYIDQSTYLEILKDDMTGNEVLSMSKMFERFLSIAMLSSVEHGQITLFSKQECQEVEKKVYFSPIELITHLYKNDTSEVSGAHDYLFKYDDISVTFEDMFKKIRSDKNIMQIINNLIDSIEKKRVFTSNDFLVVIQALDGFSIRFRKEGEFLKQLTNLRDEFKDIKRVSLTDADLKAAKGSRHYYSHILKLENKEIKNALDGWGLYDLTKKLRVLLICCVLNHMGLDNAKINQLLNKSSNAILN